MEKEDITLLAQLLHTMEELASKMDSYSKKKDLRRLNSAKKEILKLQRRINEII